jgi:hypothetical protein
LPHQAIRACFMILLSQRLQEEVTRPLDRLDARLDLLYIDLDSIDSLSGRRARIKGTFSLETGSDIDPFMRSSGQHVAICQRVRMFSFYDSSYRSRPSGARWSQVFDLDAIILTASDKEKAVQIQISEFYSVRGSDPKNRQSIVCYCMTPCPNVYEVMLTVCISWSMLLWASKAPKTQSSRGVVAFEAADTPHFAPPPDGALSDFDNLWLR